MKVLTNIIDSFRPFFLRLGVVWLILFGIRSIFYAFNTSSFPSAGVMEIFTGVWFDLVTIALFFLPFLILSFLPFHGSVKKISDILSISIFHITSIALYAVNILDIEYFKYTSKRSTFDLFTVISAGSDIKQLAWTFITDFWLLILFLIAFLILHFFLNRKITHRSVKIEAGVKNSIISYLILVPLFVITGRGGLQLKPIGIIEAAQYTDSQNTALILNTGFTLVKSYGQESLEIKTYFGPDKERSLFTPIKTSTPQHILPDGTNVMIIILESFGEEFIGKDNPNGSYTPFLDSLIEQSLYFDNAYANGKKSIEAVPAILASIPSLMDNPYISSPYGNNKIRSLVHILKDKGYSSAFFHGATNGSMRFDAFAAQAGFEEYKGRFEYGNDDHFDKTWGILDEYFNPWTAKELSKLKSPFIGTLFTISSHHPYFIPEHMKKLVKYGPQPICASLSYGDIALRKFFEEARKQKWFNNTLFVICADHTPASSTPLFNERHMMYKIPILFYHPEQKFKAEVSNKVFQQMDIMPTLLDLLNVKTTYYAFGNSIFSKEPREAIAYLEGTHYYFRENLMMSFNNDKVRSLRDLNSSDISSEIIMNSEKEKVYLFENRLKAMIQCYNRDLLNNRTTAP